MMHNNRIKILHIMWSGTKGGAEKNMADIVTNLHDDNFNMEALFLSKKEYWGHFIENKGIKTHCLQLKTAFSLKSVFFFIKFLLKHKYMLYHNHVSAPFVKIILKLLGKRVIYTLHCTPVVIEAMNPIKRKLTIGFADFYIAPSLFMRNYFEKKFHVKAIQVYHGVSLPSDIMRGGHNTKQKGCRIGTLTHLEKIKGNDILIKAAKILAERNRRDFKILIAGTGKEYQRLLSLIEDLSLKEYVEICSIENTEAFLSNLDIYVSASLGESLGMGVIEAMMQGLPIVCTKIGPFLELVVDSRNGYLCEPQPEDVAEKLDKLIVDAEKRKEFGMASYEIASQKFTLQNMIDNYQGFYLECAE